MNDMVHLNALALPVLKELKRIAAALEEGNRQRRQEWEMKYGEKTEQQDKEATDDHFFN